MLWLGWNPSKAVEEQILAVASIGGDIDLPVCGIQLLIDGRLGGARITYKVGGPTKVGQIFSSLDDRDSFASEYFDDIQSLEDNARAANPFSTVSPRPSTKDLLFKEFDVEIKCSDGSVFPAHQFVLSKSSPYFRQYFEGPWSKLQEEEGANGQYETEVNSDIMKYTLTFMYIGNFGNTSLMRMSVETLLKIRETARLFQMDELVKCCSKALNGCKSDILVSTLSLDTLDTFVETLSIAYDLKSTVDSNSLKGTLWGKCVKFYAKHNTKIIFVSYSVE